MGMNIQSGGGGGRGGYRKSYRPMSEINVTPFIDVMLVLLIVFMVTAPLLSAGIPVDLPKTEAASVSEKDDKPLEVAVNKKGRYLYRRNQSDCGGVISQVSRDYR